MTSNRFKAYEELVEASHEATLFKARVYVTTGGQVVFEYESMDPEALKQSFLKETDAIGAWRVVDRLRACSKAIDKDWHIIVGG